MTPLFSVLAAPILRPLKIPIVTWYAHPSLTNTLKLAHFVSNRIVTSLPGTYPYKKDKVKIIEINGFDANLHEDIVELAIQYGIVVEGYTAMVVVIDEPVESPDTNFDDGREDDPNFGPPSPPVTKVVSTNVDFIEGGNLSYNFTFALIALMVPMILFKRKRLDKPNSRS